MGHVISKISNKKSTSKARGNDTHKLYKPIAEFAWKDASAAELRKEAIPHYGVKFAI